MKIYTKTGDDGTTGLLGTGRVGKDDPRIESYGTVDELNAVLGLARAVGGLDAQLDGFLAAVQDDLFTIGAALADPNPLGKFHNAVGEGLATRLESEIDRLEAELSPLTQFILPGDARPPRKSTWPGPCAGGPNAWSSTWVDSPGATSPASGRLPESSERLPLRSGQGREPPSRGRRHPLVGALRSTGRVKPRASPGAVGSPLRRSGTSSSEPG